MGGIGVVLLSPGIEIRQADRCFIVEAVFTSRNPAQIRLMKSLAIEAPRFTMKN